MRTLTRLGKTLTGVALLLMLMAVPAAPVSAAACTVPSVMYPTIQDAVDDPTCDPINVLAGTYPEPAAGPLLISRTLTLNGANAGVDARGPRGAESVITDTQGTTVAASGVVINGFTVENSINPFVNGGFGILMGVGTTGTQLLNNIIQENIIGIGLCNTGGSQTILRHNLIQNNNAPGAATGSGTYTDEFVCGGNVSNVLIDENAFLDHGNGGAAINISNTDFVAGRGVFDLTVTDNTFDRNNRAFVLFNAHDSLFDGNRISNSTFVASADIRVFDNNSGLLFTNNDLTDGIGHAVRLAPFFGLPNSDIEFHYNNFERYALTGMTVEPGAHSGTVDAECNWWNSPTGPTDPIGNQGGTGEEAVGDIDYSPWLIARAPGGPCIGGLESTPGKVTGGGQIGDQDPLFSPLGDLISLPAIILSAGGASEANFGFVVSFAEGASAPKGNLVYQDRAADIRIKATSFDLLVIGAGICGPNTHAEFFGTAQVNGVSESLTVEVDDCGEPSSGPPPDTFSITTDSYSNGGPLIGGNIQIHR